MFVGKLSSRHTKCLRSLIMVSVVSLTGAAFAQESLKVPDVYLAVDHRDCMTGCVPGFGEETCKPSCDCTVSQFKEKLTFDQYKDMRIQISRNELTPEVRAFLDQTAQYCTAELDKMGVEVGEADPAQN